MNSPEIKTHSFFSTAMWQCLAGLAVLGIFTIADVIALRYGWNDASKLLTVAELVTVLVIALFILFPLANAIRSYLLDLATTNNLLEQKTKELKVAQQVALSMMEDAQNEEKRLAAVNEKLELTNAQLKKVSSQFVSTVFALDQHAIVAKTDPFGIITEVNDKFCDISGYKREELIGKTHRIINSSHHPPTFFKDLWTTIRQGKIWKGEVKNRKKNGNFYWVDTTIVPIRDLTGHIIEYVAIRADITSRKLAEEEVTKVNSLLKKSNEDLQQFAYVASHDLQEPLRVISSYIQLFQMRNEGKFDEKSLKYMKYIYDESQRIQNMIHDLLEYSRVDSKAGKFEWVSLKIPLERALSALQRSIQENQAEFRISALPSAKVDALQFSLLFQNLIGNAIKFRGVEKPIIEIGAEMQGDHPVVYVRDNGVGIDEKYHQRIFKIFQRLHGIGEYSGTGIGLSICKRIMERHKGEIWVQSESRKGSCFFITLPDIIVEQSEAMIK